VQNNLRRSATLTLYALVVLVYCLVNDATAARLAESGSDLLSGLFSSDYRATHVFNIRLILVTGVLVVALSVLSALVAAIYDYAAPVALRWTTPVVSISLLLSQIVPVLVIGQFVRDVGTHPVLVGALLGSVYAFYPLYSATKDALAGLSDEALDMLHVLPLSRSGRIRWSVELVRPEIASGLKVTSAYVVGGILISHAYATAPFTAGGSNVVLLGQDLTATSLGQNVAVPGFKEAVLMIAIACAGLVYLGAYTLEPWIRGWRPESEVKQRGRLHVACALVAIGLTAACGGENPAATPSGDTVVLQQEWFAYSGFAGEAVAVANTAPGLGISLSLREGSENIDPIQEVVDGRADFGVVAADRLITATANGAGLVAVGVVNAQTPTCFIVRADSEVYGPEDFRGLRVGVLRGTSTEFVYELMMSRADVDRSEVRESYVPFDVEDFVQGRYDVRPAFVYDEPITLTRRGIAHRIIDPAEYGVVFMGTVYFTRRELIESDPDLVQRVVAALASGWESALDDPEAAIRELKGLFARLDESREVSSLMAGASLFSGPNDRVLSAPPSAWEETIGALYARGLISDPDIPIPWDPRFVDAYHAGAPAGPN